MDNSNPKTKVKKRNPCFKTLTASFRKSVIAEIETFISKGYAANRTDFIQNAVVFYYREILNKFLFDEIQKIGKQLQNPNQEILEQSLYNTRHRLNKISLHLGTPQKIVKGKIYELRFPRFNYSKHTQPRWCYIGDESDRENPTFKI